MLFTRGVAAAVAFSTASAVQTTVQQGGKVYGQFVQYSPTEYSATQDDFAIQRFDPILNPSGPAAHVHQFFGASNLGQNMTTKSLQQSKCTNVGSGSDGNSQDMSTYWIPALYAKSSASGSKDQYVKIKSRGHKLYYQWRGSSSDQQIVPFGFPADFRMIGGNSFARSADPTAGKNIVQWICHTENSDSTWVYGDDYGSFPKGVKYCHGADGLAVTIQMPHCWNGQAFDAKNPSAHISYAKGDPVNGDCPTLHPIKLPHIFIENFFQFDSDQAATVELDSFVLAAGDTTGYSFHLDFFNGWQDGAIDTLMKNSMDQQVNHGAGPNEAIVALPAYKGDGKVSSNCKPDNGLIYSEANLNGPRANLPGCNPIQAAPGPAYRYAVGALGITDDSTCVKGALGDAHVESGNYPDDGSAPVAVTSVAAGSAYSSAGATSAGATSARSGSVTKATGAASSYSTLSTLVKSSASSSVAKSAVKAASGRPGQAPAPSAPAALMNAINPQVKVVTAMFTTRVTVTSA